MRRQFVINLVQGKHFLQKLNGTTKLAAFIAFLILTLSSFDARILLPIFILCWIAVATLRPSWKVVFGLFGFIFFMNFINIILYYLVNQDIGSQYLNGSKTILFTLNSHYYLSLETLWYLSIRQLKMLTNFMVSLVLILSITPSELAAGFTGLGVPYKFGTIVSLAFRYVPEITTDYETIRMSMQTRGMEMDKRKLNVFRRLKDSMMILIPLILTSFDRIGNIANALDLRGFGQGKKKTYYCEDPANNRDIAFRVIAVCVFAFSIGFSIYQNVNHFGMWSPFNP
jgi:energy-coupling factor transport system permease protein